MRKSRLFTALLVITMTVATLSSCTAQSKKKDPPSVSTLFNLTKTDLKSMVADMPQSIQESILTNPKEFLKSMADILAQPAIYVTLVDKQHKLPTGYEPHDLVHLAKYGLSVSRDSLQLRKSIMPEIMSMVDAARTDHVVLLFSSTYRSFATQTAVYDREVRVYGKKVADTESAVPGHSQHQMGTTIDFGCICNDFDKTAAFKWLTANAWKYGFSLTYPNGYESLTGYRYEPWHWHYITKPGTLAQRKYFNNIQQYLLLFLNENQTKLVSSYQGSDLGPGWKSNS